MHCSDANFFRSSSAFSSCQSVRSVHAISKMYCHSSGDLGNFTVRVCSGTVEIDIVYCNAGRRRGEWAKEIRESTQRARKVSFSSARRS